MMAKKQNKLVKWGELIAGFILLAALMFLLARSSPPPGVAGEVIRHNLSEGIDASPICYGDVENMRELEQGLEELMKAGDEGR